MIAGTLGLLEQPADSTLESYQSGGFTTLDVRETQTYLDDRRVQTGRVAGLVESTQEEIHVSDGTVNVERVESQSHVWTEWVADVTGAGFVVAERTSGTNPTFPFDVFWARTNEPVAVAAVDTGALVDEQRDRDRNLSLWYSGSKAETDSDLEPNDVDMGYGPSANQAGGNVGVGFKLPWNGTVVRGIIYASGYVAVYNASFGPIQFARFVDDVVLPHASVPDSDVFTQAELAAATSGSETA